MFATKKEKTKPLEYKAAVSRWFNNQITAVDVHLCTGFFVHGPDSRDRYVLASSSADCNFL